MDRRILTNAQIDAIATHPSVLDAKERLTDSRTVSFTMDLPADVKASLHESLGLDLPDHVPLRWIQGDTPSHVDSGARPFERTHLVYLTDSDGEFHLGDESHQIRRGDSFVFAKGTRHGTTHTNNIPRLLLGPMSEAADPVGGNVVYYYPTQADALANTNQLGYLVETAPTLFIVGQTTSGTTGGFTLWRIASNSTGSSDPLVLYPNGSGMTNDGNYYVYPDSVCFAAGSRILCDIGLVPVEDLKVGMKVKTLRHGYRAVTLVGKSTIYNSVDSTERVRERLYVYPRENLVLTGGHSVLLDAVSGDQVKTIKKSMGELYLTEGKIRLMAMDDPEAELYPVKGAHAIYNFALSTEDVNYGVYANGKLVECSFPYWIKKGMQLVA